ncbi:iron uptake cluster protein [Amylocystis lapponica]|nr:iron uptake cluster protein [Amylocystis lapponica]
MVALTKTVAVLGASYGGAHAARMLAHSLPQGWRVVVVDRNSHFNHLFALPRYSIVSGYEHKAFIPYTTTMFRAQEASVPSLFLHAQATALSPHSVTLSRAFPEHGIENVAQPLQFDYLLYALGSHLPASIDIWGPVADEVLMVPPTQGTKAEGIEWLKRFQKRLEHSPSVLVVGGGALGVQYAADIAEVFPSKRVTLLHSRAQLMPRFNKEMHEGVVSRLTALNVTTILGDRLDLSSVKAGKTVTAANGTVERVVRTQSGREVSADLVLLCTGQTPNTAIMAALLPEAIVPGGSEKGSIRVQRTMQVAVPSAQNDTDTPLAVPHPHLFAIGDAADAFGAINSARMAFAQAEVAVRNILKLIGQSEDEPAELERYVPDPPAIKISLGLVRHLSA